DPGRRQLARLAGIPALTPEEFRQVRPLERVLDVPLQQALPTSICARDRHGRWLHLLRVVSGQWSVVSGQQEARRLRTYSNAYRWEGCGRSLGERPARREFPEY